MQVRKRFFFFCLLFLFSSLARAEGAFDGSLMRQEPVLAAPKAGSLAGSLSTFDTGVQDLASGSLTYSLPLTFRNERGPLLANILPSYSMQQGLSEWGLGWQMNLSIKRTRLSGHINYRDDLFSSPWGLLAQGSDGHWYPEGLKARVRIKITPKEAIAYGPEGEVYFFQKAQGTPLGTYAYYLSEVKSPTGRPTVLSYETAKNVVYLKSVRYGGSGETLPYSIDFVYEELDPSRHWISFRSKFSQVYDRLIKRVVHKLTLLGRDETLWTYEIEHGSDPASPLHFLKAVTRIFPEGKREPSMRFSYESFAPSQITYETTQRLGPIAADGLDPDRLSFYDFNNDGLIDIENAVDHRLYRQGAQGFELETQFQRAGQNVCLGAENPLNRARLVVRLGGLEADPTVLHSDKSGKFTFCSLDGEVKGEESFAFKPEFHRNALLVDLNGDQKPDLLHLRSDGYTVYANRSSEKGLRFDLEKSEAHKPVPSLSSLWAADINGDSIPDIAVIGGSTVKVYMGKGDFEFTPTFLSMPIERENGEPFDPRSYSPTFVDLNQDGLADLLFTQGKSLYTFINSGRSFRRIQHESFEMLEVEGAVFTQNIMGSGEQLIFRSGSQGVRVARLNKAGTNLLQSIDDGKGTRIALSYGFFAGSGNRFAVDKILQTLSVQRSQEGEVVSRISYEEPYYRTGTVQRLGFGRVSLQDSLAEETAAYEYRDFVSVLRSSTERYFSSPAIVLKKRWSYEPRSFRGLPLLEQVKEFVYFSDTRSGQATTPLTKESLQRTEAGCETRTLLSNAHGSYELVKSYLKAGAFDDHLLCLPEKLDVKEEAGFRYSSELDYSDQLQMESYRLRGATASQELQRIVYDRLGRAAKIISADGSVKQYSYLEESDRLIGVQDGRGVNLSQEGLNERDLFTVLNTTRGGLRYGQSASFDAFDRLYGTWDNVFGSESDPLMRFDYQWPTLSESGRIVSSSQNLQGSRIPGIQLLSGSGQELGQLRQNASGDWVAEGLKLLQPAEGQRQVFAKRVLSSSEGREVFAGRGDPIATEIQGAFGFPESSSRNIEGDLKLLSASQLSVQDGALVVEELVNRERRTRTGYSSGLQKIFEVDGAGYRSSFGYDALDRLKAVKLPSGEGMELRYDDLGRVAEVRSPKAGTLRYFYNGRGLVEKKVHSDGSGRAVNEESFSYDQEGRVLAVLAEGQGQNQTLRYTYDGELPSGAKIPDQNGFLTTVSGREFEETYVYDLKARLREQKIRVPAIGLTIEKEFERDALDRLESLKVRVDLAGKVLSYQHSYNYDALGRLQEQDVGPDVLTMSYNERNELEAISGALALAYEIDEKTGRRLGYQSQAGRPLRFKMNMSTFDEVANEVYDIGAQSSEVNFEYDDRGFLTAALSRSFSEGFSYSGDGLLQDKVGAEAFFSIEGGPAYAFDGLGRMVKRGSSRMDYGVFGQLETLANEQGTFKLVYGKDRRPLLIYRDNKLYFLNWEGLTYAKGQWFEPVSIASHIVGWMQEGRFQPKNYDFRGSLVGDEPSSPYGGKNMGESSVVDFAGHPFLAEMGLVSMGVRFYDPVLGQFISPDIHYMEDASDCLRSPVECNLYSYARNNPLRYTDPQGKWAFLLAFGWALAADFLFNPEPANAPGVDNRIDTSMAPESKFALAVSGASIAKSGFDAVKHLPVGVKSAFSRPFLPGSETGAITFGKGLEKGIENRKIFDSFNEARASAKSLSRLGDEAVDFVQELGPFKGRVTGRMSPDGSKGWRLDFDEKKGFHLNWWDRSAGGKRSNWYYGSNEVSGKSYDDFKNLLDHGFPKK